jgi:hypothetical protein
VAENVVSTGSGRSRRADALPGARQTCFDDHVEGSAQLNSVAEALDHVEAPREAVGWAQPLGHDFPAAWRTCPNPCWLIHLAHAARMPFDSVLAAVTAASRYFLDAFPRDDYINDLLNVGIPIEDLAGDGVADVSSLYELASSDAFKQEERSNLGYGDGFVEQAYCTAARTLSDLEAALVAKCGHSPAQARERVLAIVRENTTVEEFLGAYMRCVKPGYAGLELVR